MKIKPRVYKDSLKCLWRRSCWFCKYFCCWLGRCCCFNHLYGGKHTFALIQQPGSCLFGCLTLTSTGTSLPLTFESLLCFLVCFRDDFALNVFALHGRVEAFVLAVLRCVALYSHRQVLFVFVSSRSFWRRRCRLHSSDFSFIPSIATRSCFKKIARRTLYSQKVQSHWNRSVRMRIACRSSWTLNQPKSRRRRA